MSRKLIIYGAGETAEIAYELFTKDTEYNFIGFCVDDKISNTITKGYDNQNIYPFSTVLNDFYDDKTDFFVAISYTGLNIVRENIFEKLKSLKINTTSFISSDSIIARTAEIGTNCFIFEYNNIQHKCVVEDNVTLWSGNHIGHRSKILKSSFLSSHICVAGFAQVGARSMLGINSSIADYKIVAEDNFITMTTSISKDTLPNSIYSGNPGIIKDGITASRFFKRNKYV